MIHAERHILAPDTYKSSCEQRLGSNDKPIPTRQLSVGASQLMRDMIGTPPTSLLAASICSSLIQIEFKTVS